MPSARLSLVEFEMIQCFGVGSDYEISRENLILKLTVEVLERVLEHCPREQTEPIAREASSSFWSFKTWLFCDRVSCRRF